MNQLMGNWQASKCSIARIPIAAVSQETKQTQIHEDGGGDEKRFALRNKLKQNRGRAVQEPA